MAQQPQKASQPKKTTGLTLDEITSGKPDPTAAAIADSQKELAGPKQNKFIELLSGLGKVTTDIFAGGAKKLGTTYGTAIAAGGAAKEIGGATVAEAESRRQLATMLNRPGISEEQKANIKLQLGQAPTIKTAEEQIPEMQKTGKQVAGESLETVLDIATAGKAPAIKEVKALAQFPKLAKYLGFAAEGATIGAGQGLAGAMEKDSDWKDAAKEAGRAWPPAH